MDCDKENIGSAKAILNNGGILESETIIRNEIVQRYWISLKKRYADRLLGGKSKDTIYAMKEIKSNEFTGDICYYHFKNVTSRICTPNGTAILDNEFKWLEFYDYNTKIKLTAFYDENDNNIEWYFDIARKIGKEDGIPYEDDLYLDVVVTTDGKIALLDEEELIDAYNRLEVSKQDFENAYNEANYLIKKLEDNKKELKEFTDRYLEIMKKGEI